MLNAIKRLVPLAMVIGILAVGYVWVNGVPGTAQVSDSGAQVGGAAMQQASASVSAPEPGQKKVVFEDLRMTCPLCRAAVSSKLNQTTGVVAYDVDLGTDSATVVYDPAEATVEDLKEAIADAGYQVRGVREIQE